MSELDKFVSFIVILQADKDDRFTGDVFNWLDK